MNFPDMPEIILRRIWQEQNFSTEHLSTSDGRAVRILSPGTPNTDGGPDFIGAKISIGKTIFHGDVELHIKADEWLSHKHHADPHYNKVILHVVLTADPLSPPARTASQRAIPLLLLHPFLDETFQHAWTKALLDEQTNKPHSLACVESNDNVPTKVILDWIEKLARERIELKVRRLKNDSSNWWTKRGTLFVSRIRVTTATLRRFRFQKGSTPRKISQINCCGNSCCTKGSWKRSAMKKTRSRFSHLPAQCG